MRKAIRLARRTGASTLPNPRVGCIIVKDGEVVGRGYHKHPGLPHAEIEALQRAGERALGSTLYVTLEPCCHFGRTPPCTEAIINAGVQRVVYAVKDSNPRVRGRGVIQLRRANLQVEGGVCAQEAKLANEPYFKFMATELPFITIKVAATLDGKIATVRKEAKWITDTRARTMGRGLRMENQAVLVGIGTVLVDDPHLGARNKDLHNPWRVVLDSRLRIPLNAQVVKSKKLIVAVTEGASNRKKLALQDCGVEVWRFPGKHHVPLKALLRKLARRGIISILVEGGGKILGSFFDQKLVDKIHWFLSPKIIGAADAISAIEGNRVTRLVDAMDLKVTDFSQVGKCWHLTAYPKKQKLKLVD